MKSCLQLLSCLAVLTVLLGHFIPDSLHDACTEEHVVAGGPAVLEDNCAAGQVTCSRQDGLAAICVGPDHTHCGDFCACVQSDLPLDAVSAAAVLAERPRQTERAEWDFLTQHRPGHPEGLPADCLGHHPPEADARLAMIRSVVLLT